MANSTIRPRNAGKRVKLEDNGNVSRGDVQELKELQLGVSESRIGHVIDEREIYALRGRAVTVTRNRDGGRLFLRPTTRNSPALNHQRHIISPFPAPASDLREYRRCVRCLH